MSPESVTLVGGVLTLLGIIGAALIAGIFARGAARGDREERNMIAQDRLIDQLQEENDRLRLQVEDLQAKVAAHEHRPPRRST